MKLRLQQIKNQDNRRFLQVVMPESPSATRPEISFGQHAMLKWLQQIKNQDIPTSGYARITKCSTSWNQFWTARNAEVKYT
jgi:hypothetical protein